MKEESVFIGTSGYHYDDWKGAFYPDSFHSKDYLSYYARFFNTLEINNSFYNLPGQAQLEKYLNPDLQPFCLSMKAYRGITHGDGSVQFVRKMLAATSHLIKEGVLKIILYQFPFSFAYQESNFNRLRMIAGETHGVSVVVEFRHTSWFQKSILEKLTELGITVCGTDMPNLSKLPGVQLPETGSSGYLRFHGRNSLNWYNHKHAWERYNYLYSEETLIQMVSKLKAWIKNHKETYIYFNNHYQGQAVKNAQMLMAFLTQ